MMDVIGTVTNFVENVSLTMDNLTKRSVSSFLNVETRDSGNEFDLICKDGSLLSIIRVEGALDSVGEEEIQGMVGTLAENLSVMLRNDAHKLQFFFCRDPAGAINVISDALRPAEAAIRQQALALDMLIDERKGHLAKYLAREDCYLAIWTMRAALQKGELKALEAETKKVNSEAPPHVAGQWPWKAVDALRARHNAAVNSTIAAFGKAKILMERQEAHDGLIAMFHSVNSTPKGWRPWLPGDRIRRSVRDRHLSDKDVSSLMGPPLSRQMFPHDAERLSMKTCRIGNARFAGYDMTLGPDREKPFGDLLADIIRADPRMPFRASFLLEGDGLRGFGMKGNIAGLLTWLGPFGGMVNRQIRDAIKEQAAYLEKGGTPLRLRASFATWADEGPNAEDMLRQRAETLMQTLTQWGGCMVDSLSGDPLEGALSSALGITGDSTAPRGSLPIEKALTMQPLTRPASAWKSGSLLLRTPDGKLFPYQPGSRRQDTWVDLIVSPPGGGKSVLLNALNLAAVLSPQDNALSKLPLISILDVGESARGLVEMIQAALPEGRRDEAVFVKLRNSVDCAVNPFDTQLGMDRPLPHERAFLINLILMAVTPAGEDKPYDGMSSLVSRLVDIAYENRSRKGGRKATVYARLTNATVDAVLDRFGLSSKLPERPTWWEVVDTLFEAGHPRAAAIAQRYAVPTLVSLIDAAQDQRIQDEFCRADNPLLAPTNERLVDAFSRNMRDAQNSFKLMSQPTNFERNQARLFVLDLDEVAQTGSAEADRTTTIMYMLARQVAGGDFFLEPEHMPKAFPLQYQEWQRARITELRRTPRRLVYDELHRATIGGGEIILRQLIDDARVGRKAGLQLAMVSQFLEDFPPGLIRLATGFWIMKIGEGGSLDETVKTLNLTKAHRARLARLNGPDADGAPMFCVFLTKTGRYRQSLVNTIGPIEMWAFSSTAEDRAIRRALFNRVGVNRALSVLAKEFPGGSAMKEFERLKEERANDDSAEGSAIDEIIGRLSKAA